MRHDEATFIVAAVAAVVESCKAVPVLFERIWEVVIDDDFKEEDLKLEQMDQT